MNRHSCIMKSSLLLFFLSLFWSVASAAEVRPAGEVRQSLNGEWAFTIDPAKAEHAGGEWDRITVPGNWDTLPAYSTHKGKGWYQRSFTVPAGWAGKHVRLRFEAVYHKAQVTLNGRVLGEHVGGYTPFEFDVTDQLDYSGPNTVTVCADNTYRRGAWWAWGGISREVNLVANDDVRILWQHIRTEPDLKAGTATVFVQYKIENSGGTSVKVALASAIRPVAAANLSADVTLAPNSVQLVDLSIALSAADVRLWHFDHPELYSLDTRVSVAGQVEHTKTDRFGIRKVEVTPEGLFLNGEHIRVPGFNRVSDSNQFGSTEPDELVRKDVDLMKQAGAVFSRLMHTPQAPNLLDYLDEKGMMIFAEIPVWGGGDPEMIKDNPRTKQWLAEMVERDYNHPSIVGWSVGNELWGHYAYVASMESYVRKELDPHRLVGYVSNTATNSGYVPSNDPITVSDLAMINSYGGARGTFVSSAPAVRKKWPEKPIFYSEYGTHQIGASLTAKIPQIDAIWAEIAHDPYVIGGALWTFNDYRSDFKGTPASGNREWGVVDVERRPKAAYWQIRKLYSPIRSLTVSGGRVSIEPRHPEDIPSYSVRGYHVVWTAKDATGTVTAKGEIPVPELKPGAPVWSAAIPGVKADAVVTASLITPTGYAVHDSEAPAALKQ